MAKIWEAIRFRKPIRWSWYITLVICAIPIAFGIKDLWPQGASLLEVLVIWGILGATMDLLIRYHKPATQKEMSMKQVLTVTFSALSSERGRKILTVVLIILIGAAAVMAAYSVFDPILKDGRWAIP